MARPASNSRFRSSIIPIFTQDLQTIEHILLTSATPQPHILLSCNLYKSHRSATPRNIKTLPSRNVVDILQTPPQDLQVLEHILLTSATPQPHILLSYNLDKSHRSAAPRSIKILPSRNVVAILQTPPKTYRD
ncbi:hypothetical protein J6590_088326 [Homalodisca vitripennis]|nr:hypothetical protein J6590_104313 [Homalodisca vitripennis]KAG8260806.1 hypothetical protein J6590_088326 [Homalodisca vitripennis]